MPENIYVRLNLLKGTSQPEAVIKILDREWSLITVVGWTHVPCGETLDGFLVLDVPKNTEQTRTILTLQNTVKPRSRSVCVRVYERVYVFGNDDILSIVSLEYAGQRKISIVRAETEQSSMAQAIQVSSLNDPENIPKNLSSAKSYGQQSKKWWQLWR